MSLCIAVLGIVSLAGCVADQRDRRVVQQMEKMVAPYGTGAIYLAGFNEHPLYEERRARNVGDMLVMTVPESAQTAKKSGQNPKGPPDAASADNPDNQDSSADIRKMRSEDGDEISFIPGDALVGKIPMTIMKVQGDGHLLVAGGKQVTDYDGYDRNVRITGEVDPANIRDGNAILSTQMTDVQLRVDEVRIHSDGTAINFSEGQNTFGNFFHSMQP